MFKITVIVFLLLFCGTLSFLLMNNGKETLAASTADFTAGNIISDYMMSNYSSMTESEIQTFLLSKNSCNKVFSESGYTNEGNGFYSNTFGTSKKYVYHIKNGKFVCLAYEIFGSGSESGETVQNGETAAHIIWQAAQDYKINPQVLIVLLQKEQGLITDEWPNNYQYQTATGYGCPDTAACDSQYYGIKNQIRNAAKLFRTVLDGGWTNYPIGENYIKYNPNSSCGGSVVNVENLATSALYRYTPYQPNAATLAAGYGTATCGAYGNRNFYLYFYDWFGNPKVVQAEKTTPLGATISSSSVSNEQNDLEFSYTTHIQDYGWLDSVNGGVMSGTTNQSKRMEAINIKLDNYNGIEYKTHIQDIGWESDYKKDGETSGTVGYGLRIEAIKIKLAYDLALKYDVYYRVHVQGIGWMDWVKNDEIAGTTGRSLRIEAIQIKINKKSTLGYTTHIQDYGWLAPVNSEELSGTTGQSKRIEAIKIVLPDTINGNIQYRVHVQDIGWMDWIQNGEQAGTTGQSKRIEAIEIRLSGPAISQYNIQYRVHVQDIGWMDWVQNGEQAGTTGQSKRIEAIEIRLKNI